MDTIIILTSMVLIAVGIVIPFVFERHIAELIPAALCVGSGLLLGCLGIGTHRFLKLIGLTLLCLALAGATWHQYRRKAAASSCPTDSSPINRT